MLIRTFNYTSVDCDFLDAIYTTTKVGRPAMVRIILIPVFPKLPMHILSHPLRTCSYIFRAQKATRQTTRFISGCQSQP